MKTISKMTLGQKTELVLLSVGFIVCIVLAIKYIPQQREVVYNCSIAEISPDIPIKVKEECRKLKMETIKK